VRYFTALHELAEAAPGGHDTEQERHHIGSSDDPLEAKEKKAISDYLEAGPSPVEEKKK
jgi:hypothetical protein